MEVLKKEKDSDKVLSGAIFGLYAADDIVSSKGKVLLAKDTLIELKTTDEDGKIQFVADLPIDSRYYIKELAAPDGYVTRNRRNSLLSTRAVEPVLQSMRSPLKMNRLR